MKFGGNGEENHTLRGVLCGIKMFAKAAEGGCPHVILPDARAKS
jgi:hypothetical protein